MLSQVLASIVLLLGLGVAALGVVLPALPAVPAALVGVILAGWITGFERIDLSFILWVGVLTLLAQGVDLLGTYLGSHYFGARRPGVIGGIVGALIGLVLLPPWGLLLGALAWARPWPRRSAGVPARRRSRPASAPCSGRSAASSARA
jgi:uncharacterized protein